LISVSLAPGSYFFSALAAVAMTKHAVATTDIIVRPESFLTTIPSFLFHSVCFQVLRATSLGTIAA
jgi:hypothetical protein